MTTAVVGGQYGSEGKGLIVGHIAKGYDVHIRVGAANAGHTLYVDGEKHVMQQVPCAAYANPDAVLVIGPGAIINHRILAEELDLWAVWRRARGLEEAVVHVDERAHVVTPEQIREESASGLGDRIGSASARAREGIGVCQSDRVLRSERSRTVGDAYFSGVLEKPRGMAVTDTVKSLAGYTGLTGKGRVLLEGTQGTGLSLTTGGPFPYCTSRNTTSAGLCADAGVPPTSLDRVILVCRTYPIRVAGNSGPFYYDSREISWEELGVDPATEKTTATKLVRRVATLSMEQVAEAAHLNGATEVALTFCDYLAPDIAGRTAAPSRADVPEDVWRMVQQIEGELGIPVTMLGTGPASVIDPGGDN